MSSFPDSQPPSFWLFLKGKVEPPTPAFFPFQEGGRCPWCWNTQHSQVANDQLCTSPDWIVLLVSLTLCLPSVHCAFQYRHYRYFSECVLIWEFEPWQPGLHNVFFYLSVRVLVSFLEFAHLSQRESAAKLFSARLLCLLCLCAIVNSTETSGLAAVASRSRCADIGVSSVALKRGALLWEAVWPRVSGWPAIPSITRKGIIRVELTFL